MSLFEGERDRLLVTTLADRALLALIGAVLGGSPSACRRRPAAPRWLRA